MTYSRFAIYYLPPEGALSDFGASWLGWDVARGCDASQPDIAGLYDATVTPRKYGFHGTLKPPFRLAEGAGVDELQTAVAAVAGTLVPACADGLELSALGRFLALTPQGDPQGIRRVADTCVRDLDSFRAPAPAAELERRRRAGLTERQEALMQTWGYPYVMEEFNFHLTLTGRLPKDMVAKWTDIAAKELPALPVPFHMSHIALCGERKDGYFELIQRYALSG